MEEGIRLRGEWRIEVRVDGVLVREILLHNQLTEAYRNSVLNQLMGDTFIDLEIDYIGVGTDATPATAQDMALGNEIFRSVPTSQSRQDGYVQTIWVIPPSQANTRLREIGVFCGDATSTANTGTLLSRVVVDIDKTSSMELTMIRRDYVTI